MYSSCSYIESTTVDSLRADAPNANTVDQVLLCSPVKDSGLVASGEVSRGERILYSGTDPESFITEYTSVYEDKMPARFSHHSLSS